MRKCGEEQRTEGDKNTANYLVRPRVFYGQSLPGVTSAEGGRGLGVNRGHQSSVLVQGEAELITCLESRALGGGVGGREVTGVQK